MTKKTTIQNMINWVEYRKTVDDEMLVENCPDAWWDLWIGDRWTGYTVARRGADYFVQAEGSTDEKPFARAQDAFNDAILRDLGDHYPEVK